ncbi:UNVERIFIED_CONTAM: Coatomer subunit beta'-1 [Sesamum calycinum]|uniref:Coatomer subunit beta'-1 n=1 Tax=Sesamum calycinum TaxID=2727403 RepID=A0AAW2P8G9_9LAMI
MKVDLCYPNLGIEAMSPPRLGATFKPSSRLATERRLATSSQAPARLRRLPSASVSSFLSECLTILKMDFDPNLAARNFWRQVLDVKSIYSAFLVTTLSIIDFLAWNYIIKKLDLWVCRRWFNLFEIGKLIARKQWVVAGSDDMFMCVYNYNTMDKVKVFEAHTGYIRDGCALKYLRCHSYYVMQVNFNHKDTNTFAGASLDHSIKIWNLGSPDPNFPLDAHLKGVNCVDYFVSGDKPYLISGSDDHTAKVLRMVQSAYGMEPLIGKFCATRQLLEANGKRHSDIFP